MTSTGETVIIGGGLAGLTCARQLQAAGQSFVLVEAADAVGGRVRTDDHEGFRLDRGFQVLLTAYPETKALLDYERLELHPFYPGALIALERGFTRMADPWRRPWDGVRSAFASFGSLADKLRVARLRASTQLGSLEDILNRPERTTREELAEYGFSPRMINRFFEPFFGGVFLERELTTSSRMFEFVFRLFSEGEISLPAGGMGRISEQLAEPLPPENIRLRTSVSALHLASEHDHDAAHRVELSSGEVLEAETVVVATDEPAARLLLPGWAAEHPPRMWRSTTCLYFAAADSPMDKPILLLNGTGQGLVNNVAVLSDVAPGYAPPGAALVSVSILDHVDDDRSLQELALAQLRNWFGGAVTEWRHLQTYRIPQALPDQAPPALSPVHKPRQLGPGLYLCGDHCDTASINGAMQSGREVAEAILAARQVSAANS